LFAVYLIMCYAAGETHCTGPSVAQARAGHKAADRHGGPASQGAPAAPLAQAAPAADGRRHPVAGDQT